MPSRVIMMKSDSTFQLASSSPVGGAVDFQRHQIVVLTISIHIQENMSITIWHGEIMQVGMNVGDSVHVCVDAWHRVPCNYN